MPKALSILHVEDSDDDAELVRLALLRSQFACHISRVDNEPDFVAALGAAMPDVILCDYDMPLFSAERAFAIMREKGLGVPFVVVSNHVGRIHAVIGTQHNADEYLAKNELGRLSQVIASALDRARGAPGSQAQPPE